MDSRTSSGARRSRPTPPLMARRSRRLSPPPSFSSCNPKSCSTSTRRRSGSCRLPYADVTLRHLLSHTSGIPVDDYDYFDKFLPRDAIRTTGALLGVLAAQKPPPASKRENQFSYSSFGFDLAALAASRASAASYKQLLRARILRPLDITSAFVRPGRLSDFPGVRTMVIAAPMARSSPTRCSTSKRFTADPTSTFRPGLAPVEHIVSRSPAARRTRAFRVTRAREDRRGPLGPDARQLVSHG